MVSAVEQRDVPESFQEEKIDLSAGIERSSRQAFEKGQLSLSAARSFVKQQRESYLKPWSASSSTCSTPKP
jgi:hypothetical protein